MLADCDCGACCEQCGHDRECIRFEMTNGGEDE